MQQANGYLREVPFMGVIYVLDEAMKVGFSLGHPDWVNLGQGQPEVGPMVGAPERIARIDLEPADHAYGPVSGTPELRQAVADYYNRTFRQAGTSQYTAANVAIVQGGRLALSRAIAALGEVNVGYMLPDYSAYEDMLGLHLARITPLPVHTSPDNGFEFGPAEFDALASQGAGAILLSNPCNPTGAVIRDEALGTLVAQARAADCALLLDEFYSHYIYEGDRPISAAAYVDDVNRDQVLLFDGLTKNHRYPGWRIGWVLGPADVVGTIDRVGSAMDGGPSRLAQRAAMLALETDRMEQETQAVRAEFSRKRDFMVAALRDMGVTVNHAPGGTFYVWGSVADLPAGINTGTDFFRAALEHQVITVPGELFDIDPGKRRRRTGSRYADWVRFSFGPTHGQIAVGLSRLAAMVNKHR